MIQTPDPIDVPLWMDQHGKLRVGKTRILYELVIHAFQQGESPEEIIDSYPALKLADVYTVLAYYLMRRAEVDAYMQQADEAVEHIQRETEARYTPETLALRARLRALRDEQ